MPNRLCFGLVLLKGGEEGAGEKQKRKGPTLGLVTTVGSGLERGLAGRKNTGTVVGCGNRWGRKERGYEARAYRGSGTVVGCGNRVG